MYICINICALFTVVHRDRERDRDRQTDRQTEYSTRNKLYLYIYIVYI